jgi:hypothetical protein
MKKSLVPAALLSALTVAALGTPASAQDTKPRGLLKICKVAGPGVSVGTPFYFMVNTSGPFQVTAGAGPNGNCWLSSDFYAPNTTVTVHEVNIPVGVSISSITANVTPFNGDISTGISTFTVAAGVNEVTYTDKRVGTGYIEICKIAKNTANYTFLLSPSGQTVTVAANTCSPPILVTAGTVFINETQGGPWTGCSYWPGNNWSWNTCVVNQQQTSVTVNAGGTVAQTVVKVTNAVHPVDGTEIPDNTEPRPEPPK